MIEVVSRIMRHTEFLHHATRAKIHGSRKANDFAEPKHIPPMIQHRLRPFRCQPFSPEIRCQSPANLDTRCEMRVKGWNVQSDEASEGAIVSKFRSVGSKPMFSEMRFELVHQCVALGARQRRYEVLHYPRISIQGRKRLSIRNSPVAENQATSFDLTLYIHFKTIFNGLPCSQGRPFCSCYGN